VRIRFVFIFTFVCFLLIYLGLAGNFHVKATNLVLINEFVPYPGDGGEEWIELLNLDSDNALSLTGWRLVVHQGPENNYTYFHEQDLSGSIPKGGFLTFATDNGARIPNEGACVVLFRNESESVYAVKFGNGTCDDGADEQNATGVVIEQGKSIYYDLDEQTWDSTSTPTRGWCNPGDGVCPTVSSIVSQMETGGVVTNLGNQADFSRISGLYFEKSEGGQSIGRITFLNEMNFTDIDALAWMGTLDSNLSMSQGAIGLNADLIKNLTSTQANLTMYNITLGNPKILVDGQDDSGGIVSGLSYNQTTHTLTFTAAHFTTFTVAENTSSSSTPSSSSGTPNSAPVCGDAEPSSTPDLFQINTFPNSAKLFFTPLSDTSDFYISFSENPNAEKHGEQVTLFREGVQSHTIYYLKPYTTYYVKVRGQNGCMPGDWSSIIKFKTDSQKYYKYSSPKTVTKKTII
jgi:hypothetical protein